MPEPTPVTSIFAKVAELAIAAGAAPLNAQPGLWEHHFTGRFDDGSLPVKIAVNGKKEPLKPSFSGTKLDSFTVLIDVNGWPACLCTAQDGGILGIDEVRLLAMLDNRIAELKALAVGQGEAKE